MPDEQHLRCPKGHVLKNTGLDTYYCDKCSIVAYTDISVAMPGVVVCVKCGCHQFEYAGDDKVACVNCGERIMK